MMMAKQLYLALTFLSLGFFSQAQIFIDNSQTPQNLVNNVLIGPGLTTSNITFSGNPQQIGYFAQNTSTIGIDSGIVMSSGNVLSIPQAPGNAIATQYGAPGDADVLATAQSVNPAITSSWDAAVLEFDFVPTGDIVTFRFVFTSDEYYTYINTNFNDAFGFYISGPIPGGGNYVSQNMALVPGTTDPITISTIYDSPGQSPPQMNAAYFVPSFTGMAFNAGTIPISVTFSVICDSTYHFKFAVADCQDDYLDTGIFMEGGSFQALPVNLTIEPNVTSAILGDSVVVEGCNTFAELTFTRPSCQSMDSLWVNIFTSGTAINSVDYLTIPDSILFEPGVTVLTIPFSAYADGTFEGFEDVILNVVNILPSGDTIITSGVLWIYDTLNVIATAQDTVLVCEQDSLDIFATAGAGFSPYSYLWNTSPTDTNSWVSVPGSPNGTYEYYITVTDACGFTDLDTLTVLINQTLNIDSLVTYPADGCGNPNGAVQAFVSGATTVSSQPYYHWDNQANWNGGGSGGSFFDGTTWTNISPGWYYFTVTDDVCSAQDSVMLGMGNPPVAALSAAPLDGCNPVYVTMVNNSQNANNYYWDFGDGTSVSVNDESGQSVTYTQTASIQLVAFQNPNCSDTTVQLIQVYNCGCTDPVATNYDPTAVINDGSCYYPVPTVIAPNIFTPNGDGENDIFYLTTTNAIKVEMVIVNRWGNKMFEISYDPTTLIINPLAPGLGYGWDGKTPIGMIADEGTYFLNYTITGVNGDEVKGHGFLQLVKN